MRVTEPQLRSLLLAQAIEQVDSGRTLVSPPELEDATRSAVAAVCAQAEGQGVRHWQQHAGPMAVQAWPSGNPHFVTDMDTPDDVRRLDAELGGGRLGWPEDGGAMPAQSGSSLSGMG